MFFSKVCLNQDLNKIVCALFMIVISIKTSSLSPPLPTFVFKILGILMKLGPLTCLSSHFLGLIVSSSRCSLTCFSYCIDLKLYLKSDSNVFFFFFFWHQNTSFMACVPQLRPVQEADNVPLFMILRLIHEFAG